MLDFRRLRTLREVVAQRSFSAAALELDYTQSNVSHQIAGLERELGVALIDRASRPINPTPAGEFVLARADTLLDGAAALERELREVARGEAGLLRMGGFFTAWATFVPGAVSAFSRARPHVALELEQLEPEVALPRVQAGDLDLAVTYQFDELDAGDHLTWTHLLDDHFSLALPADHRLAHEETVELEDLANERWICPPPDNAYARLLFRICREHGGFEPEVRYETQAVAMAQPLVAAGLAIAMLPTLALIPTQVGVTVIQLASTVPARTVWAVQLDGRRTPAAAGMIEALEKAGANHASVPGSRTG
jgi:DNA-binding transcriptional LysR family regulator